MFQNEIIIIDFFSEQVRCFIKHELHDAKYFTVLADETKDISKRELLSGTLKVGKQLRDLLDTL